MDKERWIEILHIVAAVALNLAFWGAVIWFIVQVIREVLW